MLLRVTDGRVRVWRQDRSRLAPKYVQATLHVGGGSVTKWMQTGSGDCARKDNQGEYRTDLLNPVVVSHYRARAVLGFLQLEATETLPMAVDPLSYFSFQSALHDWCNKGHGMCYPVSGMVHIKEPLLLIGKSSPCGGSGFPLSLSEWSFTIASLNKTFPSFLLSSTNGQIAVRISTKAVQG